jgi:hypothetical protein
MARSTYVYLAMWSGVPSGAFTVNDISLEFRDQARRFMAGNDEVLRRLASSERSEDPCPQCGEADLEPRGGKYVCPVCHFIRPCCDPQE